MRSAHAGKFYSPQLGGHATPSSADAVICVSQRSEELFRVAVKSGACLSDVLTDS